MGRIPMGVVPKSERVGLLVTPQAKEALLKVAAIQRTSLNMIINKAIDEYIDRNGKDIQRFNEFFGE